MYDVAIIGAGIVGSALAYELSKIDIKAVVLERQDDCAKGTSRANSAIIHAGYDPEKGTLMASSNVWGNIAWQELADELGFEFKRVGSLVVAFSDEDLKTLSTLKERGEGNGVEGLRILSAAEVREKEPALSKDIVGALWAPSAGIVNPWRACIALCEYARANGVDFRLGFEVKSIEKENGGFVLSDENETVRARFIVNAAGLFADKVAALAGAKCPPVKPVRGEYFLLDKSEGATVESVIFRCPTASGKGVLVSATVHGNLIVGPSAGATDDRDDVATTLAGLDFVRSEAKKLCPTVNLGQNIRNFAGNRAYLDGQSDFLLEADDAVKGFLNIAGIKSPGLSAAPALARLAAQKLFEMGLSADEKKTLFACRLPVLFKELPRDEQERLVKRDSRYGRVICRCETITEGDVIKALESPLCPPTVSAVKRRCNAGMGRCQGGFCSMRVHEIIAREKGVPYDSVTLDGPGGYIVSGDTKEG